MKPLCPKTDNQLGVLALRIWTMLGIILMLGIIPIIPIIPISWSLVGLQG
jgi:hypothetical protein